MGNIDNIEDPNITMLLADNYVLKILSATYFNERSVSQLAFMFDIPIATCYRKVNDLVRAGLLKCVNRPLTQRGYRYKVFKSELISLRIFLEKGKLRMRIELMDRDPIEIGDKVHKEGSI